jgi:hypothetical protein
MGFPVTWLIGATPSERFLACSFKSSSRRLAKVSREAHNHAPFESCATDGLKAFANAAQDGLTERSPL